MDDQPAQAGRLKSRKAVIVGAGTRGNIGQTIARRFLDEGAQVVIAGRDRDELKAYADANACGWGWCDMTNSASIVALGLEAQHKMGGIDIALNATGWGLMKPFLDTTPEEIDAMNVLQLRGPFVFYQEMLKKMTEGGSIIQISSIVATIMCHDHAAYMATKAATDHLIRIVANEFGQKGIRANSISPALTATPMARDFMGATKAYLPQFPLGRIGTAEDIAAAAVWLASEECFMTGENLQVNGGFTLRRHPTKAEIAATGVKLPYLQE